MEKITIHHKSGIANWPEDALQLRVIKADTRRKLLYKVNKFIKQCNVPTVTKYKSRQNGEQWFI